MNGTATQGSGTKPAADPEASEPVHGFVVSGQTRIPGLQQLLRGMGNTHRGKRGDYANVGRVDRFLAMCPVES